MSYICAGRSCDEEAREFLERLFLIAQEYFLPPYQFQVRVGGLYLLYALYNTQPVAPKVKIRLTRAQWDDSLHLQQQAASQSHMDVVYVFNRLLSEQAFSFVYSSDDYGNHKGASDYTGGMDSLADHMREERTSITRLFSYESVEQLTYLQEQYRQMKIGLAGPGATEPNKSLAVVQEALVDDLMGIIKSYKAEVARINRFGIEPTATLEKDTVVKIMEDSLGERRAAIKESAMRQVAPVAPGARRPHMRMETADHTTAGARHIPHTDMSDTSSSGSDSEYSEPRGRQPNRRPPTSIRGSSMPSVAGSSHVDDLPDLDHRSSGDDSADQDWQPPVKVAKSRKKQFMKGLESPPAKCVNKDIGKTYSKTKANDKSDDFNSEEDNAYDQSSTIISPKKRPGRKKGRNKDKLRALNLGRFKRLAKEQIVESSESSSDEEDRKDPKLTVSFPKKIEQSNSGSNGTSLRKKNTPIEVMTKSLMKEKGTKNFNIEPEGRRRKPESLVDAPLPKATHIVLKGKVGTINMKEIIAQAKANNSDNKETDNPSSSLQQKNVTTTTSNKYIVRPMPPAPKEIEVLTVVRKSEPPSEYDTMNAALGMSSSKKNEAVISPTQKQTKKKTGRINVQYAEDIKKEPSTVTNLVGKEIIRKKTVSLDQPLLAIQKKEPIENYETEFRHSNGAPVSRQDLAAVPIRTKKYTNCLKLVPGEKVDVSMNKLMSRMQKEREKEQIAKEFLLKEGGSNEKVPMSRYIQLARELAKNGTVTDYKSLKSAIKSRLGQSGTIEIVDKNTKKTSEEGEAGPSKLAKFQKNYNVRYM